MSSFAVVATVEADAVPEVGFRLRTAPPFGLPAEGIAGHQVFLGSEHAAFVFWGSDPEATLLRAAAPADVRLRVMDAAEGLTAPRRVQLLHESSSAGTPGSSGRAVAVVARGVDVRIGPADQIQRLMQRAGVLLDRQRIFVGADVALFVFEQRESAVAASCAVPLESLSSASPIVPARPLEILEETYWFEDGHQRPPRPTTRIIDQCADPTKE